MSGREGRGGGPNGNARENVGMNNNTNTNTSDNQNMNNSDQTANTNFGMCNLNNPDNNYSGTVPGARTNPAPFKSWAAVAAGGITAGAIASAPPTTGRVVPAGRRHGASGATVFHGVIHTLPPTTGGGLIETGVPGMFRQVRDHTQISGTLHVIEDGAGHGRDYDGEGRGPNGGGGAFGASNDTDSVDKAMANIKNAIEGMKIENTSNGNYPSSKTDNSHGQNSKKKRNRNRYKKQWNKAVDRTRNKQVAEYNATILTTKPIEPLDSSSPSTDPLKLAKRALPLGVAISLHLFKFFPAEIRIYIWQIYMKDNPHIIEMEWGAKGRHYSQLPNTAMAGTHWWHRVCPHSRLPSPAFHVCSESRQEALKVHKLISFDNVPGDRKAYEVYYNPDADVVLFGQDSCISTIILTLSGKTVPHVAIHCSRQLQKCCDWDESAYGVDGGVSMFQALHGFDESIRTGVAQIRGCKGLNEVSWVVNSKLWRPRKDWVGKIDHTIGFRPATTNGLTDGQKSWKRYLHQRNEVSVRTEDGIDGVGPNKWTGDDMPKFNFVSLAPRGPNGKTYDGLGCNQAAASWLAGREFAALKNVERRTGAEIILIEREYPGENPREIGFVGTSREVARAKEMVIAKIGQSKHGELVMV